MTPILWSFRRCPYAMRARLAIAASGIPVELREIVLRDKPDAFLAASPSATVPCLQTAGGVIDESLDIMLWALGQNDPEGWLARDETDLITRCDGPFKQALDRYKYPTRYDGVDQEEARNRASRFLGDINTQLAEKSWLYGEQPSLVDMALLPFIRQCAHVDLNWFEAQPWPHLIRWLTAFKTSERFASVMAKHPQWTAAQAVVLFP